MISHSFKPKQRNFIVAALHHLANELEADYSISDDVLRKLDAGDVKRLTPEKARELALSLTQWIEP